MNRITQHHMSTNELTLSRSVLTIKWAALAALALSLFGCASIKVSPQPIDSTMPAEVKIEKVPYCLALRSENGVEGKSALPPGKECWFVVQSEKIYNSTGLYLNSTDTYQITVPSGQFWYDKDRKVSAPNGDDGSWLTKHLSFMKRHPGEKWFALMATVNKQHDAAFKISSETNTPSGLQGTLYLYANDNIHFYGNNQGRIWVKIRNTAGEKSVPAQ